jgi:hypothetical protein
MQIVLLTQSVTNWDKIKARRLPCAQPDLTER